MVFEKAAECTQQAPPRLGGNAVQPREQLGEPAAGANGNDAQIAAFASEDRT